MSFYYGPKPETPFKAMIRQMYLDAMRTYYKDNKPLLNTVNDMNMEELDEAIYIDDLLDRIDAEINEAVEELEFNIELLEGASNE